MMRPSNRRPRTSLHARAPDIRAKLHGDHPADRFHRLLYLHRLSLHRPADCRTARLCPRTVGIQCRDRRPDHRLPVPGYPAQPPHGRTHVRYRRHQALDRLRFAGHLAERRVDPGFSMAARTTLAKPGGAIGRPPAAGGGPGPDRGRHHQLVHGPSRRGTYRAVDLLERHRFLRCHCHWRAAGSGDGPAIRFRQPGRGAFSPGLAGLVVDPQQTIGTGGAG